MSEHYSANVMVFINQLDVDPSKSEIYLKELRDLLPYMADALEDMNSPLADGLREVYRKERWPIYWPHQREWTWWNIRGYIGIYDELYDDDLENDIHEKLNGVPNRDSTEQNYHKLSEALLDLARVYSDILKEKT